MPKIWNKKTDKDIPEDARYCGRPGILGNPFSHLPYNTLAEHRVKTRDEAVDEHRKYMLVKIATDPVYEAAVEDLRGHDLVCWCAPARCHCENYIWYHENHPPREA
jgi:hypothetical protein